MTGEHKKIMRSRGNFRRDLLVKLDTDILVTDSIFVRINEAITVHFLILIIVLVLQLKYIGWSKN